MKIFQVVRRDYDLGDSYEDTVVGHFEAKSARDVRCFVGPDGSFTSFIITELNVVKVPGAEDV